MRKHTAAVCHRKHTGRDNQETLQTFEVQNQVRAEVEAHQAFRGDVPQLGLVRGHAQSAACHHNGTGRLQAAVLHQLREDESTERRGVVDHC